MASDETKRPADEKGRRRGKVSRRLEYRSPKREEVPAAGPWDDPWDEGDDAGSAGVREPRHPKPLGPRADAGELPMPEPRFAITLPDPRQ